MLTKKRKGVLAPVHDLAKQDVAALSESVRQASTEALKSEVARLLGFSADNLIRLALVTHELEHRGEDLSAIRIGLLPLLRLIACGKLLPQVVVNYAGESGRLKEIANMPIAEQQAILDGKQLPPPGGRQARLPNGAAPRFRGPKGGPKGEFESGGAFFHAEKLVEYLASGNVQKTDRLEAVLLKLSRYLAERLNRLPVEEVRMHCAACLAADGRTKLSDLAEEVDVPAADLAKILAHPHFVEDRGFYCLSTAGRRSVAD